MTKRCWWCGAAYENVDTAVPEGPGWVWDSETSILCTDGTTCVRASTRESLT